MIQEVLVACGHVEILREILHVLPPERIKPIATKRGNQTASKVAGRGIGLAIVHEHTQDHGSLQLVEQLAQWPEPPQILWLTQEPSAHPPSGAHRSLRYPVPAVVLRNAVLGMLPDAEDEHDLEKWRAFYQELKRVRAGHPDQDYYQILGIPHNAAHHMLVRAFDTLTRRYHPDRYSMYRGERWGEAIYQEANAIYKLITQAYSVLSNRKLNAAYQEVLARGQKRLDLKASAASAQGPKRLEDVAQSSQAKKFLQMAQMDLARQDVPSALRNLEFARSMEPDNAQIEAKIRHLRAQQAAGT